MKIIKKVIKSYVADAEVMLFGSRIDDRKKGGDIDLLVKSDIDIPLSKKIKILTKLEMDGIERKVDMLLLTPNTANQSIIKTALKEGIKL